MDITTELQKLIGEKIAEIRLKSKMTQHDVEFITGIDTAEISKYEKGKRNLTLRTLAKFAVALNVHPRELLDFEFDIYQYKIEE